jgi:hypothetical protein
MRDLLQTGQGLPPPASSYQPIVLPWYDEAPEQVRRSKYSKTRQKRAILLFFFLGKVLHSCRAAYALSKHFFFLGGEEEEGGEFNRLPWLGQSGRAAAGCACTAAALRC